jgi:hypothetical protein
MLGAVTGAVLGLVAAFILFPLPLEATWAFVIGASIGAIQGPVLDKNGRPPSSAGEAFQV